MRIIVTGMSSVRRTVSVVQYTSYNLRRTLYVDSVQCMYNVQCMSYIVQCMTYTVSRTVYIVHRQCTAFSLQCTVYSVIRTVYILRRQCTSYSLRCTVYSVQCTSYSLQRSLYMRILVVASAASVRIVHVVGRCPTL